MIGITACIIVRTVSLGVILLVYQQGGSIILLHRIPAFPSEALQQGGFIPAQKNAAPLLA